MQSFNVIWWNFNSPKPEPYDVIPYLVDCYNKVKTKPKTFEEFVLFVEKESMYQWWSRCEYEITIKKWPPDDKEDKWDIFNQIMMNKEHIATVLMNAVTKKSNKTKNKE